MATIVLCNALNPMTSVHSYFPPHAKNGNLNQITLFRVHVWFVNLLSSILFSLLLKHHPDSVVYIKIKCNRWARLIDDNVSAFSDKPLHSPVQMKT